MSDLLVVKCNYKIPVSDLERYRDFFIAQKAEGVVIVPIDFDVVLAPDDIDIQIEDRSNDETIRTTDKENCS